MLVSNNEASATGQKFGEDENSVLRLDMPLLQSVKNIKFASL
jgi:hypothetical protein